MKVDKLYCNDIVTIGDITGAVQYLIRNRYSGYSSTTVTRQVKKKFDYVSYTDRMGMHCEFRANDIWYEYFLKNGIFKLALDRFGIENMEELVIRTRTWC